VLGSVMLHVPQAAFPINSGYYLPLPHQPLHNVDQVAGVFILEHIHHPGGTNFTHVVFLPATGRVEIGPVKYYAGTLIWQAEDFDHAGIKFQYSNVILV